LSDGRSLLDAIRADPDGMLGQRVQAQFGAQLPFLLKVLAVDSPLSLQAHPNLDQARRGFERENRAGIPLGAAERTYKDANHKPELLCALTRFEALSGFRPAEEAALLFETIGVSSLAAQLRQKTPLPLRATFTSLMSLGTDEKAKLTRDVLGRCARAVDAADGPFTASVRWAAKLGQAYPGDIGAVAALLLNHLVLEPLQAVYLEAGRLHAYLSGTGVELMANSDNVLRGGLTPKHVDVPELLNILQFDSPPVRPLPARAGRDGESIYATPAPEFQLARLDLSRARRFDATVNGPELLLCIEGEAKLEAAGQACPLQRGQACFVPARSGAYRLDGAARVFRATAPG
jgi:mannose-6-phosphate isomerase